MFKRRLHLETRTSSTSIYKQRAAPSTGTDYGHVYRSLEPRELRATDGPMAGRGARARGQVPVLGLNPDRAAFCVPRGTALAPPPPTAPVPAPEPAPFQALEGPSFAPLPLTGPPLEALGSVGGQRSAVSRLRGGWRAARVAGLRLVPALRDRAPEVQGARAWLVAGVARGPGGRCTMPPRVLLGAGAGAGAGAVAVPPPSPSI
ncbi:hypothetical protein TARUN_10274, partial [Trichoderma arundinaceum]